jgi:hypothetical protein
MNVVHFLEMQHYGFSEWILLDVNSEYIILSFMNVVSFLEMQHYGFSEYIILSFMNVVSFLEIGRLLRYPWCSDMVAAGVGCDLSKWSW